MPTTSSDTTALLSGYLLDVCLFGALTVQTYNYIIGYPDDKWRTKLIVFGVYFIECAQTTLALYNVFNVIRLNDLDLESSRRCKIVGMSEMVCSALVAVITQAFYAFRIYAFSEKLWLVAVIALMSLAQFISAAVIVAKTGAVLPAASIPEGPVITFGPSMCFFGASALCDIVIAISMVTLLVRNGTEIPSTRRLLRKIMLLTIEAGIITAGVALASLALYAAFPKRLYVAAIALTLDKWYSNTLMAQLNSRQKRVDQEEVSHGVTFETTSIEPTKGARRGSEQCQEKASDQTSL